MKRVIVLVSIFLVSMSILFGQSFEGEWAIRAGGPVEDVGRAIAVDGDGNSYVTGSFRGEVNFGQSYHISAGDRDLFVGKVSHDGRWLWSRRAGSTGFDRGNAIATDSQNNVIFAGVFEGTVNFGSISLQSAGGRDIFVAKLSSTGDWLWAKRAGGTGSVSANGVQVNSEDNIVVTGSFQSTANFGTHSLTSLGNSDVFVAKLDSDGEWMWARRAGSPNEVVATSVSIDNENSIYVGGYFISAASFGTMTTIFSQGGEDGFIAKISPTGGWQWAKRGGSLEDVRVLSVAVNSNNEAAMTGHFKGEVTFGSHSMTSAGDRDLFVAKIDSAGNWMWGKRAGGSQVCVGNSIAVDSADNFYIGAHFAETVEVGALSVTSQGSWDILLAKINNQGDWIWGRGQGGTGVNAAYSLTCDSEDNLLVTGIFSAFARIGGKDLIGSGNTDIFVAKLTSNVSAEKDLLPNISGNFELRNYPNPFNPETTVHFNLVSPTNLSLKIYDVKGRLVTTLINDYLQTGSYNVIWNGTDFSGNQVASGVYFARIQTKDLGEVKRMLLLK